MNTSKTPLHVFGGAAGIGRFFIENLFSETEYDIYIWDRGDMRGKAPPVVRDFISTDNAETLQKGINEFRDGMAVIFALPDSALREIFPYIASKLPKGTAAVDVSSRFVEGIFFEKHSRWRFETHKLHPLFGTKNVSLPGQCIIVQSDEPGTPLPEVFRRPFHNAGIRTVLMTRREHEEAMQCIQMLTHFTALTVARTFESLGHKPSDFKEIGTPPFKLISTLISRILSGSPGTYANIGNCWQAEEMRLAFTRAAEEVDHAFRTETAADLIGEIKSRWSNEPLNWEPVDRVLLTALQESDVALQECIRSQKIVVIEIDNQLRIGRLSGATEDQFEFLELGTPQPDGRQALMAHECNAVYYSRQGHAIKRPASHLLKRTDLRMLRDSIAEEWIQLNIIPIQHHFTIEYDRERLPDVLFRLQEGVSFKGNVATYYDEKLNVWKHTFSADLDPRLLHKDVLVQFQIDSKSISA